MKFILSKKLLSIIIATMLSVSASGVSIIDQENTPNNPGSGFSFITSAGPFFQSFKQTANNISGAGFFLKRGAGSSTVAATFEISVYSDANLTNLIASGSESSTNNKWVDAFWTPTSVTSGDSLYLIIRDSSNRAFATTYSYGNQYSDGTPYRIGNPSSPNYDMAFRTYSDTSVPDTGSTLTFLGLGILGLVGMRRRISK